MPLSPEEVQERLDAIREYGGAGPAARALGITERAMRKWWARHKAGPIPSHKRGLDNAVHYDIPINIPAGLPPSADPDAPPIRVCVYSDAHDSPKIKDKSRARWIGCHVRETAPDVLHDNGDAFDFESLCKHIKNETWDGKFKGTVQNDLSSGHAFRDAMEGEIAKGSHQPEKTASGDNHGDRRVDLYEQQNPEMYGFVRPEFDKLWSDYGYRKDPFGAFTFHGGVGFTHIPLNGMGREFGGETVTKQIADKSTHDVVFGHCHLFNSWKAKKTGFNNYVRAVQCPTALPYGHIASYAKGMTGWDWGILDLMIAHGRLIDVSFVSMLTLKQRYD